MRETEKRDALIIGGGHNGLVCGSYLAKAGLKVTVLEQDDYIIFSDDTERTQASFARFNKHDAAIYPEFTRYIYGAADVIRPLLFDTPPDPTKRDWKTFRELGKLLWKYRKIGNRLSRSW